jgi:hypothetical protein
LAFTPTCAICEKRKHVDFLPRQRSIWKPASFDDLSSHFRLIWVREKAVA